MICTLSKHEAEAKGYDDALMLDYRGYLAEGTGANLFLVIDGVIHTPTPDCFLDGITRRTVIELARARGYEIVERHLQPEELSRAREVFLTGTAVEVTPVREIDEHAFEVGELTRTLIADFDALTREPAQQAAAVGESYAKVGQRERVPPWSGVLSRLRPAPWGSRTTGRDR